MSDTYTALREAVADDFELGVIVKAGVRALLSERDALAAEVERLRAAIKHIAETRHRYGWGQEVDAAIYDAREADN